MANEINQRVFLLPETDIQKYTVLKLKHPRTGTSTLCALDSCQKLYEIVHFMDEFSSWLVEDTAVEDGSLFLLSIADPLFFVLPYVNKNEKYCPLEDLLVDENNPEIHQLSKCCADTELSNIFDMKESSGFKVFCYNKVKTLHWLQKKVKYLAHTLKCKDINTSDGSKAASLQLNIENEDPKKILSYSCNLVAEYLSEDLFEELLKCLGIEKEEKGKIENGTQEKPKKQNTCVDPIDDYTKKYSMNQSQNKQQSKLTSAQKKLQKVDKKGMKSISAFFQKK